MQLQPMDKKVNRDHTLKAERKMKKNEAESLENKRRKRKIGTNG